MPVLSDVYGSSVLESMFAVGKALELAYRWLECMNLVLQC